MKMLTLSKKEKRNKLNMRYFLLDTLGVYLDTERFLKKQGFHAVCYMGTMPRFVQIETWFMG